MGEPSLDGTRRAAPGGPTIEGLGRAAWWAAAGALVVVLVADAATRVATSSMATQSLAWTVVWIAILTTVAASSLTVALRLAARAWSSTTTSHLISAVVVLVLLGFSLHLRRAHWDLGTATPMRAVGPVAIALVVLVIDRVGERRDVSAPPARHDRSAERPA